MMCTDTHFFDDSVASSVATGERNGFHLERNFSEPFSFGNETQKENGEDDWDNYDSDWASVIDDDNNDDANENWACFDFDPSLDIPAKEPEANQQQQEQEAEINVLKKKVTDNEANKLFDEVSFSDNDVDDDLDHHDGGRGYNNNNNDEDFSPLGQQLGRSILTREKQRQQRRRGRSRDNSELLLSTRNKSNSSSRSLNSYRNKDRQTKPFNPINATRKIRNVANASNPSRRGVGSSLHSAIAIERQICHGNSMWNSNHTSSMYNNHNKLSNNIDSSSDLDRSRGRRSSHSSQRSHSSRSDRTRTKKDINNLDDCGSSHSSHTHSGSFRRRQEGTISSLLDDNSPFSSDDFDDLSVHSSQTHSGCFERQRSAELLKEGSIKQLDDKPNPYSKNDNRNNLDRSHSGRRTRRNSSGDLDLSIRSAHTHCGSFFPSKQDNVKLLDDNPPNGHSNNYDENDMNRSSHVRTRMRRNSSGDLDLFILSTRTHSDSFRPELSKQGKTELSDDNLRQNHSNNGKKNDIDMSQSRSRARRRSSSGDLDLFIPSEGTNSNSSQRQRNIGSSKQRNAKLLDESSRNKHSNNDKKNDMEILYCSKRMRRRNSSGDLDKSTRSSRTYTEHRKSPRSVMQGISKPSDDNPRHSDRKNDMDRSYSHGHRRRRNTSGNFDGNSRNKNDSRNNQKGKEINSDRAKRSYTDRSRRRSDNDNLSSSAHMRTTDRRRRNSLEVSTTHTHTGSSQRKAHRRYSSGGGGSSMKASTTHTSTNSSRTNANTRSRSGNVDDASARAMSSRRKNDNNGNTDGSKKYTQGDSQDTKSALSKLLRGEDLSSDNDHHSSPDNKNVGGSRHTNRKSRMERRYSGGDMNCSTHSTRSGASFQRKRQQNSRALSKRLLGEQLTPNNDRYSSDDIFISSRTKIARSKSNDTEQKKDYRQTRGRGSRSHSRTSPSRFSNESNRERGK